MADFVKIQAIRLPSLFPTIGFVDLLNVEGRVVRNDFYYESFETDKVFRTIDDDQYINRPIQTILYNRYNLSFITKENIDATQVSYSEICYITTEQGEIHRAKFIDFNEGEFIAGTTFKMYKATYYDISKDNYLDAKQPINNFLLSSNLVSYGYTASNLWQLRLTTTRTDGSGNYIDSDYNAASSLGRFQILTKLEIEDVSEATPNYSNNKTKQTLAQTVLYKKYAARFYVNEEDKSIIERYTNAVENVSLFKGATSYTSVADVEIDIQDKDLAGIYEVNITLTSEISYTNYAETSQLATMGLGDNLQIIHNSTTYNYYTLITPDFDIEIPEKAEATKPDGVKIITKKVNQETIVIKLYCNESNKNTLKKYIDIASSVIFTYNSVAYTSQETIEPKISPVENAIELYEILIKLKYSSEDLYPYAT